MFIVKTVHEIIFDGFRNFEDAEVVWAMYQVANPDTLFYIEQVNDN